VRLVDHESDRPRLGQRRPEAVMPQALRRDVDQPEMPAGERQLRRLALLRRHAGVQGRGGNATGPQGIHLVLHQGDERGDDDGGTVEQERGELEAEGLARACRHDRDQVAALEHSQRRLALAGAEAGHAEALVEGELERFDSGGGSRGHRDER
jgi:hypothetical protein